MASLLLPILLATAALASPPPAGYGFCATVSKKISAASEQAAATAYCSSYLSVPVYTSKAVRTKTITTTKAAGKCTSTVTAPETTSVVTSTITSVAEPVSFSVATTVTDVVTSTPEAATIYNCQVPFASPDNRKREVQNDKPKKPNCLSGYTAKTAVSSACSCVSVRPSTTTIATKTSTIIKTITERHGKGVQTTTPTKLVTSFVTQPETPSTTTTFTESVTSTTVGPVTTVNAINVRRYFAIGAWKEGSSFNGFYLHNDIGFSTTNPAVFAYQYRQNLTPFSLQDSSLVDITRYNNPYPGGADPNSPYQDPSRITFAHSDRGVDTSLAVGRLACSVDVKDDFMCYLNCALGDKTTNYICADGSWYLGTDMEAKEGCEKFTPLVAGVSYQM